MLKFCSNCKKESKRIRKSFCDTCYTKYRTKNDANYMHPESLERLTLAKYLNWTFVKDGVVTLDTQNAKRYLKKYVDEKILIELPRNISGYNKGIKFIKNVYIL